MELVGLWASPMPVPLPLIRCFNYAEVLNTITRRGEIGTSVPVFGLRADTLAFLAHHERSERGQLHRLTLLKAVGDLFQTSSTKADDSVRDKPTSGRRLRTDRRV